MVSIVPGDDGKQPSAEHRVPFTLYKSDISYFSGKLEALLRYKQIPYRAVDCDRAALNLIYANTGFKKMPAVRCENGDWLYDTTPAIQWFERHYPQPAVLPDDPALAFLALLLEDYADEWLWRPAMWWRWVPRVSRWALGWRIGAEFIGTALARPFGWYFGHRQRDEWLWGDGLTRDNADAVRDMLYSEFAFLEPLLEEQPFLLGSHPSVADFGYFGPMFRHFGNDPDPAEIMRRQAPNTYEWLARLWNARAHRLPSTQEWRWPKADYWAPLLARLARDYLPYLHQNALAHRQGLKRFDYTGASISFPNTKTTVYRVWCREVLQQRYAALGDGDKSRVVELFATCGSLDALHADGVIESGIAHRFALPRRPDSEGNFKQSLKQFLGGQPRN